MMPTAALAGRTLASRLGFGRLEEIGAAHGSTFYLLDAARLRANVRSMVGAFRSRYARTAAGHSLKTNYVPHVCRIMLEEGAAPEVVSAMEYELALRAGAAPDRIIVNGPVKPVDLLERALGSGALVNADSMQEVELIRDVARRRADRPLRVGLRCNFPMSGLARSRFGIDADGDDLDRAAGLLRSCANVHFVGLHCHVGGDRSAASYAYRVARMIELADRLFPGAPPRIIDVGGGFAGPLPEAIAAQYRVTLPSYEEYADAVAGPMARRYGQAADGPTLVIEPGIGLLADVMEFVCEVAVLKDVAGQGHAVATGSVYEIKPFLGAVDLPLEVVAPARAAGPRRRWVVSGYTCMEIDVMHKGIEADLAVGDYLAFSNTGAYTVVLKPPFISPAPAIVALEDDGVVTVARRAEVLDDILRTYTGASA